MRVMMSLMMPVVAIAFATSPLVGQNFGARQPDRVRQAYRSAALLAGGLSLVLMVVCQAAPAWFIRLFSSDPAVVAYGSDYLRIIAWAFMPASLVHVSSSAFQGLGNTLPVLVGAVARLAAFTIPVILIARWSGFEVVQVWYLAVASSVLQMGLNLYLLNRAFRNRLQFAPVAPLAQEPASD
jgi:Na+-driven multidrug efflux pump